MEQVTKQGTSQKGICGKLDNQIGTLYTEQTFPKITNWLHVSQDSYEIRRNFHI